MNAIRDFFAEFGMNILKIVGVLSGIAVVVAIWVALGVAASYLFQIAWIGQIISIGGILISILAVIITVVED